MQKLKLVTYDWQIICVFLTVIYFRDTEMADLFRTTSPQSIIEMLATDLKI